MRYRHTMMRGRQTFTGLTLTKSVEGVGYLGFENVSRTYTGVWRDTMDTGITL